MNSKLLGKAMLSQPVFATEAFRVGEIKLLSVPSSAADTKLPLNSEVALFALKAVYDNSILAACVPLFLLYETHRFYACVNFTVVLVVMASLLHVSRQKLLF